ncbi:SDR family NAD(P)-dependent oxidoreductase [Nocardioides humi]|uniref:SDR family oxidoreductase n=1 Tax=Nocardioides humi TaxID=449461 RepID=A0ABN2BSW4_9ACTN|nr:SDR family NAD(P)-dependent oxidoreductase [Nocardioides humi]
MTYSTPDRLFSLAGKVAMVTGGSRGLGAEMVRAFAAAGADVVIASRRLESCEELAAEVRRETGRRALPIALHAGAWDQAADVVDAVLREMGGIDVLVNNAGMSPVYPDLASITEELWQKVFDVNLRGPFRLSQLVAPTMVERGGGSIVNIGTAAVFKPRDYLLPYAAAKSGVLSITEAMAHAYGPTVRVNAIIPGRFFSDISKHWDMDEIAVEVQQFAARRGGEVDEIVGAALYLASGASSYTTGAQLRVDGGYA